MGGSTPNPPTIPTLVARTKFRSNYARPRVLMSVMTIEYSVRENNLQFVSCIAYRSIITVGLRDLD